MNYGKLVHQSEVSINQMESSLCSLDRAASSSNLSNKTKELELQMRLKLNDHTVSDYSLNNLEGTSKKNSLNTVSLWQQSIVEGSPTNKLEDKKIAQSNQSNQVLQTFIIAEERLCIIITAAHIHVLSLRCNRTISQSLVVNHITACLVICLNQDSTIFNPNIS